MGIGVERGGSLNKIDGSRLVLIGGLVIMLFFGTFSNNQNAFATNTEEQFLLTADGELYPYGQFFFIPLHLPFCAINHWHSSGGVATSTNGVELPETLGECGYGATLPGTQVTRTTCDNPGEICRPGAGVCDRFEECTADGFCPVDLFLEPKDVTSPCDVDQNVCTTDPVCDGSGPSCPSVFVTNVGAPCGPGTSCTTDMCDANAVCQMGSPKAEGAMCGDDTVNLCNFADTCDAAGNCLDNLADPGDFCIGTNGFPSPFSCDAIGKCGTMGECIDQFQSPGTECGLDIPTTCDTKNTCNSAGECVDNVEDRGFLCDITFDACDENDECDGDGNCEDLKTPKDTSCGDIAGSTCTDPDTCDGFGVCDSNDAPFLTPCNTDKCQNEACGAGTCNSLGNEPDGKVCGPAFDTCHDPKECQAGACAPGAPISCTDGNVCTNDFCVVILGCQNIPITTGPTCGPNNLCINPIGGGPPVDCNDNNSCTTDSCNPASGACTNTPTAGLCDDSDSCTTNDMCDSSGACVGNSDPVCLVINPSPNNESFNLNYACEANNEVSITSATFTRDGVPLEPSNLSLYCPPGIVFTGFEFTEIPNDFTAEVTINGVEGLCVIPEGEDITAISFDLDGGGAVECFRGEGSAAKLILSTPTISRGSGGGSSSSGDRTAPTLKSASIFGAKTLQDDGTFGFGGILQKEIKLTNSMPTAIVETGTDITFRVQLYEKGGKDALSHITLYTNVHLSNSKISDSDTYLRYDKGEVTLKDPNGIFSKGDISFVQRGDDTEVVFELTAQKTMDLSDIFVRAWDNKRNSVDAKFVAAIEIVPATQLSAEIISDTETTVEFGGTISKQDDSVPTFDIQILNDWAGLSNNAMSDSEMLSSLEIQGEQVPSWMKDSKMAKWVIDGNVSQQELVNAMKYLEKMGWLI